MTNRFIDVQNIMSEIKAKIRSRAVSPPNVCMPPLSAPAEPDWSRLEGVGTNLEDKHSMVGQLPPEPPTFRGRLGNILVKIVRRALFWYTPPIVEFQKAAISSFYELLAAIKTVAAASRQSWTTLDTLNRQVIELRAETDRLEEMLGAQRNEIQTTVKTELFSEIEARQELDSRLKDTTREFEALAKALAGEREVREELGRRIDGETAAREALAEALAGEREVREELGRRIDGEIAAREALAEALAGETGARGALTQAIDRVSSDFKSLGASIRQSDIRLLQLRSEVINQNRRVSLFLEEARKRLPAPFDKEQLAAITDEDKHALDAVYVSFEDMFRGTREEIKDRSRVYLSFLQSHKIGASEMPILDVGCGRGEWLEVLSENSLEARGIDINRVLLTYCKEAGLNVAEADILEYLKKQPDSSLGAVTGFHIIEHLPFDILVRVFDETVRVLKPGGLAIFETPNPQNVLVGSHTFYLDFTHRNPIPPLTAQFILEARGLHDVQILPLHPYPEPLKLQDDGTEVAKRFNEYFYGPQDYAVIGRKA